MTVYTQHEQRDMAGITQKLRRMDEPNVQNLDEWDDLLGDMQNYPRAFGRVIETYTPKLEALRTRD